MNPMIFIFLVLSLLTSSAIADVLLTRVDPNPKLKLGPQQPSLAFNLTDKLPRPPNTITNLTVMPPTCAKFTGVGQECPVKMEAMNVTYDDCGSAWTVCRCSSANMTLDTVVDRLARVPVGLRRYVGTVFVMPDTKAHAYTLNNGDIHMFADCGMETWLHEASHSFDFGTQTPHSSSEQWKQAVAGDKCAPDDYAITNLVEEFAQMSVMKFYSLLHADHLPPGWTSGCMSRQLDYMASLSLFNATTLFGNTCAITTADPGARHVLAPASVDPTSTFSLPTSLPTSTLPATTTAGTARSAATGASRLRNAGSSISPQKYTYYAMILLATFLSM